MNTNLHEEKYGFYNPKGSMVVAMLHLLRKSGISRGIIRKAVSRGWKKLGYKIVDAEIRGIRYRLHIQSNTTDNKLLTRSNIYDKQEILALARGADNNNAFVDVGANTGYYSLSLSRFNYSKIIAIEPNPTTLNILSFNVRENNIENKVTIVPLCIGDGRDTPFYCSGGLGDASVFSGAHNVEPIIVKSKPLLDILQQENVTHIGGMKLDIEGFEDRALMPFFTQAPRSLFPKVIVIEVCNKRLWENNIVQKMTEIGYDIKATTRGNQILTLNN